MINKFRYGQTLKIWLSQLSISLQKNSIELILKKLWISGWKFFSSPTFGKKSIFLFGLKDTITIRSYKVIEHP